MQPSSDVAIMVALLRRLVAPNEACTHRGVVLTRERARSPVRDGSSTARALDSTNRILSHGYSWGGAAELRLGVVKVPLSTSHVWAGG